MKVLLTFAFLFFFFSSFAQNAKDDQNYFPCKQGMKWVYNNDSTRVAAIEIKKITGNEIFIQTKTYLEGNTQPITEVYTFSRNMLLKTRTSEGVKGKDQLTFLAPAQIILKFPIEEKDSWTLRMDKGSFERKIFKKHATLKIKDKTYNNVLEVDERNDNIKRKYFYCKNIGLVQINVQNDSTGLYSPYMTLVEYK